MLPKSSQANSISQRGQHATPQDGGSACSREPSGHFIVQPADACGRKLSPPHKGSCPPSESTGWPVHYLQRAQTTRADGCAGGLHSPFLVSRYPKANSSSCIRDDYDVKHLGVQKNYQRFTCFLVNVTHDVRTLFNPSPSSGWKIMDLE